MKKIFFLFLFLAGMLQLQAITVTHYLGRNQINDLLEKLEDKKAQPVWSPETEDSNSEEWKTVAGLKWGATGTPSYIPADENKDYSLLEEIDWSGYSYSQKNGTSIHIKHTAEDMLNDLSTLKKMNFSGNNFRDVTIELLPALTEVDLSNNPTLQSLSIINCPELEVVNITGSNLSFATINTIKSNISLKQNGTFNYRLQGEKALRANAVDLTDILAENGTSVDNWSVQPVSNAGGVYVFSDDQVGNTITCTLKNSNYPDLSVQYQIKLLPGNTVYITINEDPGSTIEVESLPASIGETITIGIEIEDLYELISFTINGENKTGELTKEGNKYRLVLELLAGTDSYTFATKTVGFSGEGAGTSESPYLITTQQQLMQVKNNPGATYKLVNDITLNLTAEGWEPITGFYGMFDGNGHVILDLWIDSPNNNAGLFSRLTGNAEIKNLGVIIADGKTIKGNENVGGIAGLIQRGTISGCFVTGSLEGKANVGGIAGAARGNAIIRNSYSTGGSVSSADRAAGILAHIEYGQVKVTDCYSTSIIYVAETKSGGGIIGSFDAGELILTDCMALNPSISVHPDDMEGEGETPNAFAYRVISYIQNDEDITYNGNYAFSGMLINGEIITTTTETKHGEGKTAKEFVADNTSYTNWDFTDTWTKGNSKYPLPVLAVFASANQPSVYPEHLSYRVTVEVAVEDASATYGNVSLSATDETIKEVEVNAGDDVIIYFTPKQGYQAVSLFSGEEYITTNIIGDTYTLETVLDDYTEEKMIYVAFSGTVGIDKNEIISVSVYPNPTQDRLFINGKVPGSQVVVYDVMGKTVLATQTAELDLSSFATGIYFVEVDGNTLKVLKK
ncbi:MAG: T9SS type A sorting domain-containing protein [Candidatus Azobacteroides sp.]|nr:T9SS type A sorting domain-containing protein [Candidatus Azobacteroides sp.]